MLDNMLDRNDDRTITANVNEVLYALEVNLAEHKEIVAEARIGYIKTCKAEVKKAQEKLANRLTRIGAGKVFEMNSIHFPHQPPTDHSREFETVIKMLELHKSAHVITVEQPKATITLKAVDVQRFVLNDWQWMDNFLLSNSGYSGKSMVLAAQKGLV